MAKPEEKKTEAPAPGAAPAAPAKPAEDVKPQEVPLSYPPPKEKMIGTAQEQVLRNWNSQAKDGRLQLCADEQCYYPVVVLRKDEHANEPIVRQTAKGRAVVGVCTWDPRHCGGEQLMYPPKKDDSI